MKPVHALFLLVLTAIASGGAVAHHAFSMFDQRQQVLLEGEIKEFQWTNPHSYIQLLVKDAAGKEVEWSLEMAAPTYLANNGWRPSTLKPGQQISVTMSPLVNGSNGGLVLGVTTADGRNLGGNSQRGN